MNASNLAVIGLIFTGIGLIINSYQIRQTRQVTLGQFLLQLDQMFMDHVAVHRALRPGGKWADNTAGPQTPEEMADVEAYMGLLERLAVLIEKGMIDRDVAQRLYGYRVGNIVMNAVIREKKLDWEAKGWKDFIKLCRTFGYEKHLPKRALDILSQETEHYGT
jgi:hypothetical protein